MLVGALAIAIGYALGAIPLAYLAARWSRGIDLRRTGSGNAGASNLWQNAPKVLVVPIGLAQIAQGLTAVLVARALGCSAAVQVAAGLAAVVAQQWNPWLRLSGGRGVGLAIGVTAALSPAALGAFAAISLLGVVARRIPEAMLLAIVLMPATALLAGEQRATVAGLGVLAALLVLKRLAANNIPPDDERRRQVFLNRVLHDRDTRDRDAWVRRTADSA